MYRNFNYFFVFQKWSPVINKLSIKNVSLFLFDIRQNGVVLMLIPSYPQLIITMCSTPTDLDLNQTENVKGAIKIEIEKIYDLYFQSGTPISF